jgi:hypothetical protein
MKLVVNGLHFLEQLESTLMQLEWHCFSEVHDATPVVRMMVRTKLMTPNTPKRLLSEITARIMRTMDRRPVTVSKNMVIVVSYDEYQQQFSL